MKDLNKLVLFVKEDVTSSGATLMSSMKKKKKYVSEIPFVVDGISEAYDCSDLLLKYATEQFTESQKEKYEREISKIGVSSYKADDGIYELRITYR